VGIPVATPATMFSMSFIQSVFLGLLVLLLPPLVLALLWSAESRAAVLGFLELSFRRVQARLHVRPALAWIGWARRADRAALARAFVAEAARTGDPEGILEEGLLCGQGAWGPGRRELAAALFLRAAEAGSVEAMYWVAEDLRSGANRSVDTSGAKAWLRRGAQGGSGACMAALAQLLRSNGSEIDLEEAARWELRLAASGADPRPRRSAALAGEEDGADPLVRTLGKAADLTDSWFERPEVRPLLPTLGWTAILLMLGTAGILLLLPFFYGGLFALPLIIALATLLPLAWRMHMDHRPGAAMRGHFAQAEAGDPNAAFAMGMACLGGRDGMPKDPGEARRWLRTAAEGGHLEAMVEYASLLRWDIGGFKDPAAADQWLQRAAEAGHAGARMQVTKTRPGTE